MCFEYRNFGDKIMNFAQRLAEIIEERGLTLYRVSKGTGISGSLLGYYRSGRSDPSSENLIKLADYFNLSVDYLLGRTNNPEVNP